MCDSRSKTTHRPSGVTSTDTFVPSVVVNSIVRVLPEGLVTSFFDTLSTRPRVALSAGGWPVAAAALTIASMTMHAGMFATSILVGRELGVRWACVGRELGCDPVSERRSTRRAFYTTASRSGYRGAPRLEPDRTAAAERVGEEHVPLVELRTRGEGRVGDHALGVHRQARGNVPI